MSANMKTLIITGPTATGKSALSLELAKRHGGIEIINADSMLVYKGLDIGTAKPPVRDRQEIPHHLIDLVTPDMRFSAGDFVREARKALDDIHARNKRALIIGGTGFYLKALLFGLWKCGQANPALRASFDKLADTELFTLLCSRDATSANRIGRNDRYRLIRALELTSETGKTLEELQKSMPDKPDPSFVIWSIDRQTDELIERIKSRTSVMINSGLLEEARRITAEFPDSQPLSAVGYAQAIAYLQKRPPAGRKPRTGLDGLNDEIVLATRQLVKKQRTFLKNLLPITFILDRDYKIFTDRFMQLYGF
ncbi:MAG: tRNA (adenosine(37)-N6)-dimethylallyltransferase MiaA [Bdellovibrionota bacterium]